MGSPSTDTTSQCTNAACSEPRDVRQVSGRGTNSTSLALRIGDAPSACQTGKTVRWAVSLSNSVEGTRIPVVNTARKRSAVTVLPRNTPC